MSARQNKKQRKGRNNPNTRERTVTTLTEDPNTPYLVPLPSEEPAGTLMSSPFSVASSSAGNAPSSSAYQPPSNYEAFAFTDFTHQPQFFSPQAQQQQQQPGKVPAVQLPGANDLERLENLKNIIKTNQHSNYRPIPQPAALAAHYLGPIPPPAEPTQYGNNNDGPSQAILATGSGPSSPVDNGRRPPRLSSKEWENSAQRKLSTTNGVQPANNVQSDSSPVSARPLTPFSPFSFSIQTNQPIQGYGGRFNEDANTPAAINTSNLQAGSNTNSAGPLSAGPKSIDTHMTDTPTTLTEGPEPSSRFDSSNVRSASGNPEPARIPADRLGHGETGYGGPRGPPSTDKSTFDNKDELRTPRDSSWSARDGSHPDDRRRDLDRPPPSPRMTLNGNAGGSDTRSNPGDRPILPRDPLPRDDRYYDRERERERERDYRDRDRRDWDRDRRPTYDRFRGPPEVVRRPPPEQRHYEPDYGDRGPPRRYDIKEEPISDSRRLSDLRRLPSPMVEDRHPVRPDDNRPPLSARLPPSSDSRPPIEASRPPPHPDTRAPLPAPRPPTPDNRPVREPSFGDRHAKPGPPEERRGPPLPPDVRAPVPPVRSAEIPGATRPADTRSRDVPLAPVEASRPPVALEERSSRPSLQDRISDPERLSQQPPASRPEPARPASLEERLSAIPVSADSREQRGRIPERPPPPRPAQPIDDRTASRPPPTPPLAHDDRRVDDRPGRYTRPMSPVADRATYPPPSSAAHSSPIVREDPRAVKSPPSPRPVARDYRPARPLSRERSGGSYRPEDRNYVPDDRRSDAMDVDASSRYNDSRSIPYNRPFSPPSAADLARDRARAAQYPPSPPRPHHDAPPYDDDRRYGSGRDWPPSYQSSYDRRRDWSAADEEYYKSRQWERNAGPPPSSSDRDRFDRERNGGWETRDERDRRDFPPPRAPSPSRPYDGAARPLSSRLTENFSSPVSAGPPPSERSYPPLPSRDAPPPFSRVRQRSLSPARRSGGPVLDDSRPPAKRSRDDGYGGDYYPSPAAPVPAARDQPPLRRPNDYPPMSRGSSPPPSSGGSGYFDNRGPPPSSATTASAPDRDYSRDYPVQSYERPRSPPRGATYSRGGYTSARDTRDDRRYPPPPPSSSMLPPRRP
ncbi:hypothetical protein H0H87_005769 [Tephrocybe sp. NHM501043]|nr:hypothetical protein H0H87_005769 [Tephrocybe sp. NHM501043]